MKYDGTELKLQPGDLAELAKQMPGCTEAHLRTVVDVETNGKGYDIMTNVAFLFEPHKFYANLKGAELQEAIKKGLAYKFWKGPGSYPKSVALRWAQFQQAVVINETAAIMSASWGLGQIMGSEYTEAGYTSPQEMLTAFWKSEKDQVQGMVNLIKARGLDKDLVKFPEMANCRHFALRYNGSAYEKNNYHNKLHDAFVRNDSRLKTIKLPSIPKVQVDDTTLRVGDSDTAPNGPIRRLQELFKEKGYSLQVDGNFGPGTRAVVLAWKGNQNMQTITPDMSVNDVAALIKSGPMPVAAERMTATVEDLKPSSSIIQKTSLGQKILGYTGLGTVVGSGVDSSGVLDKAQDTMSKAQQAKGVLEQGKDLVVGSGIGDLLHTVMVWKFEILVVAVIAGFFILRFVQKKRLEMHQTAEVG